jgi:hypothetical protein
MSDLFEGLEKDDLKRLVSTTVTIDKFVSKLGDDKDVMTVSFTVEYKEPAVDLMVFLERGYDWILDADVSSGELDDGRYMVFVELERDKQAAENIVKMVDDIGNLTDTKLDDWTFLYGRDTNKKPLTVEEIESIVPISSQDYEMKFPEKDEEQEDEEQDINKELDAMLETAGIPIKKTHRRDQEMDAMRSRAGLL